MERVPFAAACKVWLKIGLLSFGGPAGQIALMHRELVEKRHWIDEERFLHALNYCMLLPGPEAQQLATYVGWLLHKTRGGLFAGIAFVLPGALVILGLSALYAGFSRLPLVAASFFGLKAAVLAVVLEAVLRIGRRAIKSRALLAIAFMAFAAIFLFHVPFPAIVVCAGVLGFWFGRRQPLAAKAGAEPHSNEQSAVEWMAENGALEHTKPSRRRALVVLAVCGGLWLLPVVAVRGVYGSKSLFFAEAWLFSKLSVVTFGGAYAVLAYVAQQAVETHGWLTSGEMLDGLGLAETTPGPLILVLEFVGFLAAFRHGGDYPWSMGLLGAGLTLWVTFVPCFLWIFLGAPYIEALRRSRALAAALSGITAAVVGVILNLSVWFALHVLFARVTDQRFGPLHLQVPELGTLDPLALALCVLAVLLLFRTRLGLPLTLASCSVLGAVAKFALR